MYRVNISFVISMKLWCQGLASMVLFGVRNQDRCNMWKGCYITITVEIRLTQFQLSPIFMS